MTAPLLLFAHGAGLSSRSPWMEAWAARLGALGQVERFDYPYMAAGSKRPDPLPVLIEAHREALADATARWPDRPVVAIGKSMGSRVGCHLALTEPAIRAIVCLGYPLAGAGRTDKLRDEVLRALRVPILFVQGTRDELCPLPLLERVRGEMQAPNALHVVDSGDHSLQVTATWRKQAGRTQDDADADAVAAIAGFLALHVPPEV